MTTEQENIKNLTEQLRSIKKQLEIANQEYIKKNCTIKPGERLQCVHCGNQVYVVAGETIEYNPFSGQFEFVAHEEEWPWPSDDSMNFSENEVIWLDRTAENMEYREGYEAGYEDAINGVGLNNRNEISYYMVGYNEGQKAYRKAELEQSNFTH